MKHAKIIDWSDFILELLKQNPSNRQELNRLKRQLCKKFNCPLPTSAQLLSALDCLPQSMNGDHLKKILTKRAVRTLSGIAAVAVLTKPYPCPGNCAYCPNQPNVPRSYLSNEPAVMRAAHCNYQPIEQVHYRLKALEANGHQPTKIELIVIGGTWSALPDRYQYWYLAGCFFAANTFKGPRKRPLPANSSLSDLKKWLKREQRINETANYRIVGLTLETRPDHINQSELTKMRELGATRIELGVQALDDDILKLNRRQSTVADIIAAGELARSQGFKLTYHFMPGLPGSTPEKDYQMFDQMFSRSQQTISDVWPAEKNLQLKDISKILSPQLSGNPFNPDQLKFYPTVVTKGSLLYRWWQQGRYQPYSDKQLNDLIVKCKKRIPPSCRIIRLIRDIPGDSIIAGNKITNLRQILKQQGVNCRCIRCREAGSATFTLSDLQLHVLRYDTLSSKELFISYEDRTDKLYGFIRLSLPTAGQRAWVRELHVYGRLAGWNSSGNAQHRGLGARLLKQAENIAATQGYRQLRIIAGIGVRNYYRKFGYRLQQCDMVKRLDYEKNSA